MIINNDLFQNMTKLSHFLHDIPSPLLICDSIGMHGMFKSVNSNEICFLFLSLFLYFIWICFTFYTFKVSFGLPLAIWWTKKKKKIFPRRSNLPNGYIYSTIFFLLTFQDGKFFFLLFFLSHLKMIEMMMMKKADQVI